MNEPRSPFPGHMRNSSVCRTNTGRGAEWVKEMRVKITDHEYLNSACDKLADAIARAILRERYRGI